MYDQLVFIHSKKEIIGNPNEILSLTSLSYSLLPVEESTV
jgi:hypothetical protein